MEPNDLNTQNVVEKKTSKPILAALILCSVLALGGVGFGVWSILKVNDLNGQIASLESKNAELAEKVEQAEHGEFHHEKNWESTDVRDGAFYVLDANGNVLAQSNLGDIVVNEIKNCTPSIDETLLECMVNTSAGEGWILYDDIGDALSSSFETAF